MIIGVAASNEDYLLIHLAQSSSMPERVLIIRVIADTASMMTNSAPNSITFHRLVNLHARARDDVSRTLRGACARTHSGSASRVVPGRPEAATRLSRLVEHSCDDNVGTASVPATAQLFPPGMFPSGDAGERHASCRRGPTARSQKIPRPTTAPRAAAGAEGYRDRPCRHGDFVPSGAPIIRPRMRHVTPTLLRDMFGREAVAMSPGSAVFAPP